MAAPSIRGDPRFLGHGQVDETLEYRCLFEGRHLMCSSAMFRKFEHGAVYCSKHAVLARDLYFAVLDISKLVNVSMDVCHGCRCSSHNFLLSNAATNGNK